MTANTGRGKRSLNPGFARQIFNVLALPCSAVCRPRADRLSSNPASIHRRKLKKPVRGSEAITNRYSLFPREGGGGGGKVARV